MKHTLVRAKIHRAIVTDGNLNYQGSITIGRNMLKESGILPFELVHVNNVSNGKHWETYVIPGPNGVIVLNGAPTHHFKKDEVVVIMAMAELLPNELGEFSQKIVYVDAIEGMTNVVTSTEEKHLKDYL